MAENFPNHGINPNDSQYSSLQQAFAMQYITVIIIIFAFLVGTFSRRNFNNNKDQPKVIAQTGYEGIDLNTPDTSLKSELSYPDLINVESLSINENVALPLAELLKNHDLIAEISLNLNLCNIKEPSKNCFIDELKIQEKLARYFESQNLPADSYTILYSPGLEDTQSKIRFLKG